MVLFLLPVLALQTGAGAGGVAAVTAALTAAWPVFGLHAGWLVDRVPRAALFVSVNLARALTLAALSALSFVGGLHLWILIAAAAILGAAETLIDTALTSSVPRVVEPTELGRANGRVEATINTTNQLMGPALAALLALGSLVGVAGLSGVLYGLAAIAVVHRTTRRRLDTATDRSSAPRSLLRAKGLLDGLRFVWNEPVIRTLTLFTAGMNIVWGAATALLVVYVAHPEHLGLSATSYGLLLTGMAVGGILASVLTDWLSTRVHVGNLLLLDCVGTAMLALPVALGGGIAVVAVGVVVAGAGSSVWRVIVTTIRQRLTPHDQLGRVYAASRTISWGVLPVSAAFAGLAAEAWGVRVVFAAATVWAVGLTVRFAGRRGSLALDAVGDHAAEGSDEIPGGPERGVLLE